jgi:hypothetical protein
MKRKRKSQRDPRVDKRTKPNHDECRPASWSLLEKYYPHVTTLRQFLASAASTVSNKRRKTILRYGRKDFSDAEHDQTVATLLDSVVVGASKPCGTDDIDDLEKDITVFTQQVSDSTLDISLTQGYLKQSEVGLIPYVPLTTALSSISIRFVPHIASTEQI